MPYLISSEKNNNKFEIEFYIKDSSNNIKLETSEIITFSDGYYKTLESLSDFLNTNYFCNSLTTNIYLKNIKCEIDKNSNKCKFSFLDNSNITIEFFKINFKKFYIEFYSLAYILGFNKESNSFTSSNNILESNYCVNINNNNSLYFCFDEFQSNIIETHKLFYKDNMSTNKILAKIDTATANQNNNFYITDLLEEENTDNVRKYTGNINLNSFNIKIIDYFGNIVNRNINDNIIFTLEIQINRNKLISIN